MWRKEVFCNCDLTQIEGKTLSVEASIIMISFPFIVILPHLYSRSDNHFDSLSGRNFKMRPYTSQLGRSEDTGHFEGGDRDHS